MSFQELATRVSHRNTGKFTNDPMAERLLARVAADENLHMIFYRNLLNASLQIAPDQTMEAILDVVEEFEMPGAGIPGFQRKAVEMAVEGIYDQRQHHDEVVMPVLRYCKVFEMEGLAARARSRAPSWRSSSATSTPPRRASSRSAISIRSPSAPSRPFHRHA